MSAEPWKKWVPGVLSKRQVGDLISEGLIQGADQKRIEASSMDLVLDGQGWELTQGSVKPTGGGYIHTLKKLDLCRPLKQEADGTFKLQARQTYLFGIQERLFPSKLVAASIYGQATAKSSIGRMDVLARLIVDGMDGYEGFDPKGLSGSTGEMYLEVTPLTFNVLVKAGVSLSQLRFFFGDPHHSEVKGRELYDNVLRSANNLEGMLSVDLSATVISGEKVAAFSANDMPQEEDPIPLWTASSEESKPDPCKYWKFVQADPNGRTKITKAAFYILRSKERIQLPAGVAVYCRAIDETIGEMRIHYAGFVHPWFGMERGDGKEGTPLIFEVRGHDVNVNLSDGEKMARLTFYRMSQDAERESAAYNDQELQLSQRFRKWPERIRVDSDGKVTEAK